jgi:DNA-binding GntR family transcriptional regulator
MDNPRNKLSHEMGNADWLTLLRENAVSAEDLPERLKCDRDFMLRAIEIDANSILSASQDIQIDRNTVLSAIQNGAEFQLVAMPFNDDHEVLLEAIRAAGFCPEQSPFVHGSKRM